jgi:hypothetical protein
MIFHRGREMAHQEVGRAKMTRLLGELGDQGQIETPPRMEGNVLVALLAPKKGSGVAAPTKASELRAAEVVGVCPFSSPQIRNYSSGRQGIGRFRTVSSSRIMRYP